MTNVVIPESLLETIRHLLTPGDLKLPSAKETRKLVERVARLAVPLLADGEDREVRIPDPVKVPMIGNVTHLRCSHTALVSTIGAGCAGTGRGLDLQVTRSATGLTVVGATVMEVTADPSQPFTWSFSTIDGIETRGWQFAGDTWSATLMASRRGSGPWTGRCTRHVGESTTSSIDLEGCFEDVRDAFDALVGHLPAEAVPQRAWLPDSRLHAPVHERVRMPRSTLQRIAALLVPGDAPPPQEGEVHRLIAELVRIAAPLVRIGHEGECSIGKVSLPVFGAARTAFVQHLGTQTTIAALAADGLTFVAIRLTNVDGHAEVRGGLYGRPPSKTAAMPLLQWAWLRDADVETLAWTFLIGEAPRDWVVERRLDSTRWTTEQLDSPGGFTAARQAFEALVRVEQPEIEPGDPAFPDSRLRD